jgi:RND family efflux transporter MFP subunit
VLQPEVRDIPSELTFTGRIAASQEVHVYSPASGLLIGGAAQGGDESSGGKSAGFEEGKHVEQGDVLFLVARNPDHVGEFFSAQAAAHKARGQLESATKSRGDLPAAQAALASARTRVQDALAKLDGVQIVAPISGVIGRRLIDPGNYVRADGQAALAVIRATDSVRVDFHVAERQMLRLQRESATNREARKGNDQNGRGKGVAAKSAAETPWEHLRRPVQVRLSDGTDCGQGLIDFVDHRVDPSVGGIAARATLPNSSGLLYPGMSVEVRLTLGPERGVTLVREQAVRSDSSE